MKKLICVFLVLSMVFSLGACGKSEEVYDVEITLPAELVGQMPMEDLDQAAENGLVHSAVRNEDGSVTYVMSQRQHEALLKDLKEQFQAALDEIVASSEDSGFTKVEANEDYTHFTVATTAEELGLTKSISDMMFCIMGGMYAVFSGASDVEITVDYVSTETGEMIDQFNSAELGA